MTQPPRSAQGMPPEQGVAAPAFFKTKWGIVTLTASGLLALLLIAAIVSGLVMIKAKDRAESQPQQEQGQQLSSASATLSTADLFASADSGQSSASPSASATADRTLSAERQGGSKTGLPPVTLADNPTVKEPAGPSNLYTGQGNKTLEVQIPGSLDTGYLVYSLEGDGKNSLAIDQLSAAGTEEAGQGILSVSKKTSGSMLLYGTDKMTKTIKITASGSWQIKVYSMSDIPRYTSGEVIRSEGSAVFVLDGSGLGAQARYNVAEQDLQSQATFALAATSLETEERQVLALALQNSYTTDFTLPEGSLFLVDVTSLCGEWSLSLS